MISIKQDAELMTNFLPANPVAAGSRFVAFRDEDSSPAVFSLSKDHKLVLIISVNGTPTLVDFGKLCGITGNVQAFDMRQGSDFKTWIAVEVDAGSNQSEFVLIFDLKPKDLLAPPQANIVKGGVHYEQLHGMYMSNFTRTIGGVPFPLIFLAFQPLDRITKEDQLGYVDITLDSSGKPTISLNTSWSLATNPLKIVDVAFGTCPLGEGAFVLYDTTDGRKLQFRTFGSRDFSVEVATPPGALCVACYKDPKTSYSVLLVGGDQITQFTYRQYVVASGSGTTITAEEKPLGIKDIDVAQSGDSLTIWYTTVANGASYYSTSISTISKGFLVRLIPDGEGGRISGFLFPSKDNPQVFVNTLVSANDGGNLTILQQASDTGIWDTQPFYTSSNSNNIEVKSFTLRIQAVADNTSAAQSVSKCQLHLTSSGYIEVFTNGVTTALNQDGGWYGTDETGVLTIIISAEDISCHTVLVDKFKRPDGPELPISTAFLNPTQKISTKLEAIKTGEDLLNAKTQTGQNLIEPGTVSIDDANTAAKMIIDLNKSQVDMFGNVLALPMPSRRYQFSDEARNQTPILLAGELPSDPELLDKFTTLGSWSSPWDWFQYLLEEAKGAIYWVTQKVGDFIHLVIEWAGEVFRFVLDSIVAIGKALSWVFAKIGVGIKKLIEFVGFLFSWGDIIDTSDSIVAYLNAGLAYGGDQLTKLDEVAKAWIEDLRVQMHIGRKVKPDDIPTGTTTLDPSATSQTEQIQDGVSYNWSAYQMKHGGFTTGSSMTIQSSADSDDTTLKELWDDIVNEVTVVEDLAKGIIKDIGDLFTPNTDTNQIFARLTNQLINAALDTFENVVDFMLKAIAIVLRKIGEMGNYKIEVPVFSALWKSISGGRDFTIFNFLALVVAIPTTVMYKLVTGSAPPKLAGRLTKDTFASYVTGDPSLDPKLAKDIASLGSIAAISVGVLSMELTIITMGIDSVGGSSGVEGGAVAVGPVLGNIIDSVTISLGTAAAIFAWPLKYKHDQNLHWGAWGLDVSNILFLSTSRFVGWKFDIRRVETKRFVGVWEFLTSIPTYILEMIINVDDLRLPPDDPDKDDYAATRRIVQDTFQIISAWSFCVAALTDELQDEITYIALAVFGLSLSIKFEFELVGVILDHSKHPGSK